MAEALILSNFTVNTWQWDEQLGAYGATAEKTFSLHVGETYRLVCNGVSYEPSAAQDVSAVLGAPAAAVGGLEAIGLPGNGSTFIIGDIDLMGVNMFLHTGAAYGSPPGACTFSLYRVGGQVDENGIQLKDRDGAPIIYEGVTGGINVLRADGTEALYVDSEGVPELVTKNVTLDFSDGDMVVAPDEGQAFSAVNIPKPVSLIPDNIAEGVDIAGIVGTLAAGGGGNVRIAVGKTTATDETITHNLGVIPDIIIVVPTKEYKIPSGTNFMAFTVGFSSAMMAAYPDIPGRIFNWTSGSNFMVTATQSYSATTGAGTSGGAYGATETTFVLKGGLLAAWGPHEKVWIAIGGLT